MNQYHSLLCRLRDISRQFYELPFVSQQVLELQHGYNNLQYISLKRPGGNINIDPVVIFVYMCTSILKGPTLSILQPTAKLRLQFSEQRCYVGCILIPCIDKVGPFEMDVRIHLLKRRKNRRRDLKMWKFERERKRK